MQYSVKIEIFMFNHMLFHYKNNSYTLSHFRIKDKLSHCNRAIKVALENDVIMEKLQASIPPGHKYIILCFVF